LELEASRSESSACDLIGLCLNVGGQEKEASGEMSPSSSHGRGKAVPQESEMQGSDVLDEVRGRDRLLRGCKLASEWMGGEKGVPHVASRPSSSIEYVTFIEHFEADHVSSRCRPHVRDGGVLAGALGDHHEGPHRPHQWGRQGLSQRQYTTPFPIPEGHTPTTELPLKVT
jgi:hypothetical protein